jgi:hypothetical protein
MKLTELLSMDIGEEGYSSPRLCRGNRPNQPVWVVNKEKKIFWKTEIVDMWGIKQVYSWIPSREDLEANDWRLL